MPEYSAILNLPGNSDSNVLCCDDCGVCFLWPYIPEERISDLYDKSYFTGVAEGENRLQVPPSDNDYDSEFAAVRLGKFRQTVARLLELSPGARSILDIGAATGAFLAVAREYGLETAGIELSAYAAARAKQKYGFVFHQTAIADYFGTEKYDLVHMNHVLEHFVSPHKVLARLEALVRVGGMVYVEVPFQFNLIEVAKYRLSKKRKAFDVFSLHHPVFHRPGPLRKLFQDHGFDCKFISVFNWSRYPALNLIGHLKRLIWFASSLVGQGIVIEAIFQKTRQKM